MSAAMDLGASAWRKVAAILATLALALVMFGPSAQASACPEEPQLATASADQHAQAPAEPCADACCPCVSCHGPSAAGFAPANATLTAPSEVTTRHVLATGPPPARSLPFGLERPPRA